MLNIIVITSYVFSVCSFMLFCYLVLTQRISERSKPHNPEGLADVKPQGALRDMANLVEALSKLTDSFTKSGPTIMALVAAIFFLLIAVIGSGFDSLVAAVAQ
jgi:hypothetical protein